ncbi:N-acetylmuramidase domain-containing protein [Nitrincola iocasae]|nr:N-acetylmuramidase domain-containing protein [Nitrincola iocasae]
MELNDAQHWKIGDEGPVIRIIQTHLRTQDYMIAVDGDFGPETDRAVREFQQAHRLIVDGIVGEKTYEALLGRATDHFLGDDDITHAAELLGVDPAAVYAVKEIESRGNGFLPGGRVAILYERHIMRRRLLANGFNRKEVINLSTRYPVLVNQKTGGYRGLNAEHFRLKNAQQIHSPSALESCSWGLFQIMGFHWQNLGFDSVEDFVALQRTSEANQLGTFVRFIQADPPLWEALKAQDWAAFARRYNGPGYKKNHYDTRLAEAYARHQERAV